MSRLPLLISVPHAGLHVPPEAQPYCKLTATEVAEDGDVGAREIYRGLESQVEAYVTTDVARAIIDLNRAVDDRRADGVVKTHTCWNVPVYEEFPPDDVIATLLERYYRPYHARLRECAESNVVLGVDCHTMAAHGPPVGPDPGVERPRVCLSNADGTCSDAWIETLRDCFLQTMDTDVRINDPFQGGYITRSHAVELPWVQLELSRAPFVSDADKGRRVLEALTRWCKRIHAAGS